MTSSILLMLIKIALSAMKEGAANVIDKRNKREKQLYATPGPQG
jgi:hypothetical protein